MITQPLTNKQSPKLIVYSNLHHRDLQSEVKTHTSKFVRLLSSKDDVYVRRMIVGEEWIPVDTGWIKQVGYMRIKNEGGKPFNVIPTPEQIAEEASRIIDIGYVLTPNLPEKEDTKYTKSKRTMFDAPPVVNIAPVITIEPLWMIHNGEHMEGKPHPTFPMFMRCRHGEVSVTIVALPD